MQLILGSMLWAMLECCAFIAAPFGYPLAVQGSFNIAPVPLTDAKGRPTVVCFAASGKLLHHEIVEWVLQVRTPELTLPTILVPSAVQVNVNTKPASPHMYKPFDG
jgi:hypothetical protein